MEVYAFIVDGLIISSIRWCSKITRKISLYLLYVGLNNDYFHYWLLLLSNNNKKVPSLFPLAPGNIFKLFSILISQLFSRINYFPCNMSTSSIYSICIDTTHVYYCRTQSVSFGVCRRLTVHVGWLCTGMEVHKSVGPTSHPGNIPKP